MKQLFEIIVQNLEKGEAVVLATVIGHKGSVPRSAGAKMVVCQKGQIYGTIGGGLVESNTIEKALETFHTEVSTIFEFNMTNTGFTKGEMICGGHLKIMLQFIDPENKATLNTFKNSLKALNNREQVILTTRLDTKPYDFDLVVSARDDASELPGPALFPHNGIQQLTTLNKSVMIEVGDQQFWCEPLMLPAKLYLFGGGHVSQAIAAISHTVGFETIVIDDRPEIISPELFPADCILKLIPEFENCFEKLDIDENSCLVIVTRSHIFDMLVLEQALKSNPAYVGMMGSRRKRNTIYDHLSKKGITPAQLEKVHSPIGLSINAETPAELAISILGELIQHRGEKKVSPRLSKLTILKSQFHNSS